MTTTYTTNPDNSSNSVNTAFNTRAAYQQIIIVVVLSILLTVIGSMLFNPALWTEVLVSSTLTGIVGVGILIWTIKRITVNDKLIASSWLIGTGIRFISFTAMGMILILAAKYSPLTVLLPGLLIYLICMALDVLQVKKVISLPTTNTNNCQPVPNHTSNQNRMENAVIHDDNHNNPTDHLVEAPS